MNGRSLFAGILCALFVFGGVGFSEAGLRRDEIEYTMGLPRTVLEGTVVDSETGEPIAGATVSGSTGAREFGAATDDSGRFSITLIGEGPHPYTLSVSAVGYDPLRLSGSAEGELENLGHIGLRYHPFDLELSENSGSLTRYEGESWGSKEVGITVTPRNGYETMDRLLKGYELTLDKSVKTLVVKAGGGSYETWTELEPEKRFLRAAEAAGYWVGKEWEEHGYRYRVIEKTPVYASHHVELSVEGGGVGAELGSAELQFHSPATTTLTLTPPSSVSSGTHHIEVKAHDAAGRLVQTAGYQLSLRTRARPSSPSSSRGSSSGSSGGSGGSNYRVTIYVQGLWREYISGASVELRDGPNGDGSLIASGTTDSSGKVEWNLEGKWRNNERWYPYASHPDWLPFRRDSFHTGTGGPKSGTVRLYRGSYRTQTLKHGRATARSNGDIDYDEKGEFRVKRGSNGWKGGSISLSLSEVSRRGDKITPVLSRTSLSESHLQSNQSTDITVEIRGADGRSSTTFAINASASKSGTWFSTTSGYSRDHLDYVVELASGAYV